jgi:hypothetical protein
LKVQTALVLSGAEFSHSHKLSAMIYCEKFILYTKTPSCVIPTECIQHWKSAKSFLIAFCGLCATLSQTDAPGKTKRKTVENGFFSAQQKRDARKGNDGAV